MKISCAVAAVTLLAACASTPRPAPVASRTAPLVDYHQHLISPSFMPIVKSPGTRDGAALVRELDAAGIDRAVVLSVGYSFADERKALPDPDRLTRAKGWEIFRTKVPLTADELQQFMNNRARFMR